MAVTGLELFSQHFQDHRNAFILIGGAACDLWFAERKAQFRRTKDLDIVLVADSVTPAFVAHFWRFIETGGYKVKSRTKTQRPALYRFAEPDNQTYPFMVELFCRSRDEIALVPEQHIIPVRIDDARSLSAILLNESYYQLLRRHCRVSGGIQAADGTALIPLKVRAWLDLTARQDAGETVSADEIKKHRNDVFRLAATLPGEPGDPLIGEPAIDLANFLDKHRSENPDWSAIQDAIRPTVGGRIAATALLSAIRNYYRLESKA